MERAKGLWDKLGLPKLRPQSPWFGAPIGAWIPQWDAAAERAATGRYLENGRVSEQLRRGGIQPETRYVPGKQGSESER